MRSHHPHTCLLKAVLMVLLSSVASGLWAGATRAPPQLKMQAHIQARYTQLPLSFEANRGQTDKQVKFLSRGAGHTLFLTSTEAVLVLKKSQALRRSRLTKSDKPADLRGAVLRMHLVGANPAPRVTGEEKLSGQVHYLIGKDPRKWQTYVPTYTKVKYEQVYPRVDLIYYGNQSQLEYDFVLAPGADPHALTLAFEGVDRLEVDTNGELVLHIAGGNVRMHKPTIYQEADGIRQLIAGSYVRKNEQRVGFHVATYDPAKPLVIDPVLVYSTYLGGSSQDYGLSIAADRTGHAYVTGLAQSVDFPTKNPLQPALNGGPDAFVAKLSRDGSKLVYATFLGGSDGDGGTSIAVDRFGQAYVAGSTQSTDFPTRNAVQPTLVGKCEFLEDDFGNVYLSCEPDVFVAKLNSTGSTLIYSTYLAAGVPRMVAPAAMLALELLWTASARPM